MSHPAKLSLRAPPHLPFVQGWPGIPSSPERKPAAVHGTVEVRIGPQPIKARWVRAEIRKYESAPPGFPSNTTGETWEHVGEVATLWAAPSGKEWETLQQADFKFYIPLPDHLPPSVDMSKGAGVRYELVAALCYRQKGGVFKKESAPIMKIQEEIRITNHEAHSAWPIYNLPDSRSVTAANGELTLSVSRPTSAFGPGDRILFTASLKSMRRLPFKLKGFECHLHETVTVIPAATDGGTKAKKGKGPPQPIKKTRTLASARQAMDESVGKGGEKAARMDMAIPSDKLLLTVRHARNLKVEYDLEIKAVCDSGIPEISMRGLGYVVGPFARPHAQQAVRDIGHVDALCPGLPPPTVNTPSTISSRPTSVVTPPQPGPNPALQSFPAPNPSPQPPFPPGGFYPGGQSRNVSQPVQGFVANDNWRRKSSGSTITTTTTATYDQHQANGRPQSMQYKPATPNPPSASSTPGLGRSGTVKTYDSSLPPSSPIESIDEQRSVNDYPSTQNNRYSSMTSNTFGPWDGDLRKTMVKGDNAGPQNRSGSVVTNTQAGPTSKPPPSAWISAEQEKAKLFDEARNRAARAQQSSGADLQDLGLDLPTVAPPEYAPRRPELPNEDYKAPSRPVSVYTAKSSVVVPSSNLVPSALTSPASSPLPALAALPDVYVPEPTNPQSVHMPLDKQLVGSNRRPDSMPRTSSSAEASSSSRPVEPAYLSAAAEKEQQRRLFEQAQNRVISGASVRSPAMNQNATVVPAVGDVPIPYNQIFPTSSSSVSDPARDVVTAAITNSGSSEKEQIRRYQEAQNRLAQSGSESGFVQMSSSAPPSAPGSTSVQAETAGSPAVPVLSEKEQMRRYYEAQDRVAQASGQGSSSGLTSPALDLPSTRLTKNSPLASAIPLALTSAPPLTNGSRPVAGLSEQEQMRRYYEAQDRVAQAGGQSSAPTLVSSFKNGPPSDLAFHPPPPVDPVTVTASGSARSGPSGVPPSSGLSEKEQMRRFYEAQDRVARAAAGQSSPDAGSSSAFGQAGPEIQRNASPLPIDRSSTPLAGPSSRSTVPHQRAASGSGSGSGSGFLSAEAEKEMIRRRFEDAQAAVERNKRGSLSPPPEASSSWNPPPPIAPVIPRDTTSGSNKPQSRTSLGLSEPSVPAGPPPPLPTKPPMEYINLLSPAADSGPSFATFGVNGSSSSANGPSSGVK